MHAMLTNSAYRSSSQGVGLVYEDFLALGGLSFVQLAELRHRGAFSTVSRTFAACCVRCVGSANSLIGDLPKRWYQVCHAL